MYRVPDERLDADRGKESGSKLSENVLRYFYWTKFSWRKLEKYGSKTLNQSPYIR